MEKSNRMSHITEDYLKWQPKYAAYKDWTNARGRQEQAVKEMACEALEVLAIFVKANRKGKSIERADVVDELGDTLWGLVGVMDQFDISWEELCNYNIEKLTARMTNGK